MKQKEELIRVKKDKVKKNSKNKRDEIVNTKKKNRDKERNGKRGGGKINNRVKKIFYEKEEKNRN